MYAIISYGTVDLLGGSFVGDDGHYVLFISLYESQDEDDWAIYMGGNGDKYAILYAPKGAIKAAGTSIMKGAAVGKNVTVSGTFSASYPFPAQHDDSMRELAILSYIIK